VGAEWGSERNGNNFKIKREVFAKLAAAKEDGGAMVHSLRCIGSAALNLCAVATGQQDLYWEGGCWAWDVAAGWCILIEVSSCYFLFFGPLLNGALLRRGIGTREFKREKKKEKKSAC